MYRLRKLNERIQPTDYWYNTGWVLDYTQPNTINRVNTDEARKQIEEAFNITNKAGEFGVVGYLNLNSSLLTFDYIHLFIYEEITHTPRGNKYVPRESKLS